MDVNPVEAAVVHCCACAKSEDARLMVEVVAAFLAEGRPGEAFDAAEQLFVLAMKRETMRLQAH